MLLLTGLALVGPTAPPLQLRWDAPPECPSHAEVHGKVLEAIGDPDEPRTEVLEAEGRIEQTDDGRWAMELTLAGSGTRTLDAGSCRELADAAVLILAIAIDPDAMERLGTIDPNTAPTDVPATQPKTEEKVATPPKTVAVTPTTRVEEPTTHLDLQIAAGAEFGPLPGPGGWFAGGLAVWGRWWRVEIEGSYTTPSEETSETNPDVGGRIQLWSIGARAGPVIPTRDVSFPIAAGFEAGGMHGRGVGELQTFDGGQLPWIAFFGGAAAVWRPAAANRRIGIGLRVEGIAALTRPRFGTDESGTIYKARAGGARVAVLFAVRLR